MVKNHQVRALGDTSLIFDMVLGIGIKFSKSITNKLGSPTSGLFAMNQILDRPAYG